MARTKQKASKSVGGKTPKKDLVSKAGRKAPAKPRKKVRFKAGSKLSQLFITS